MAKVEESWSDRSEATNRKGDTIENEVPYLVFDAAGETEALSAAKSAVPQKRNDMRLARLEITERVNDETWRVRAIYEEDEDKDRDTDEEAEVSFEFETGGARMHRNQSLETVDRLPADAPDYGGAIEVDAEGNVNGIDVAMPCLNFSETHTFRASKVNTTYKKTLAELTGTMNKSSFRGFAAGEVLFLGASGSRNGDDRDDPWRIVFKFAVSPNKTNLQVGGLTVAQKRGWDYLWVKRADKISADGSAVDKETVALYVERVYEQSDFRRLGIGG